MGRLDTTQYKQFLEEVIVPAAMESPSPLKLVHDRYPVHHARAVNDWFAAHRETIDVPPCLDHSGTLCQWKEFGRMLLFKFAADQ